MDPSDLATIAELATTMLGHPPESIEPANRGGNNRLYKIADTDAVFALKLYPQTAGDTRDRLGTEFSALSFLGQAGIDAVPRAIVRHPQQPAALYQWIDGAQIHDPTGSDIDAALYFMGELKAASTCETAQELNLASEACLSAAEVVAQIHRRMARLSQATVDHPEVKAFLEGEARLALDHYEVRAITAYNKANLDFHGDIGHSLRTLSPSDFGFHNCLRLQDGTLRFIDFEYFGWDDPSKVACDFALHPGMSLSPDLAERFICGALDLFKDDRSLTVRIMAQMPLFMLRWCMIILNEFLPERWARRQFAGETSQEVAKQRQLDKARNLLSNFRDFNI